MEKGVRLIGNGQAPVQRYWHELLQLIRDGKIDPLHMVTHRINLDEVDTAYHKLAAREKGIQKTFVQTRFSNPPAPGTPQKTSLTA
jgi:threonine dehydrogenase-like Zn-dependent dehydrogenase